MSEKIIILETRMNGIESTVKEIKDTLSKFNWLLIVTLLSAVGTLIAMVLKG